jgi:putative ABC transport system permease protein
MSGVIVKERVGERGARALDLKIEDVDRLEALEVIDETSVEMHLWNQVVRAGDRTRLLTVIGLDADGLSIRNFIPAEGRFFQKHEVEANAKVAFLGAETRDRLFGRRPAVGKTVRVNGVPFRVVGVAEKKGDQIINMGDSDDKLVLVPYTSAMRWFQQDDAIDRFIAAPRTREESAEGIRGIRSVLALHHDFEPDTDITLNFVDIQEVWMVLDLLFTGLKVFLVGAGLVTLLVGAVGVMNIMLVVVGERIQEIGLRKALGASDRAIFTLFLAEAAAVSTLSGTVGALVGFFLIMLTRNNLAPGDPLINEPIFHPTTTATVVICLVLVGILAGIIPAIRASKIPPAESLRSI